MNAFRKLHWSRLLPAAALGLGLQVISATASATTMVSTNLAQLSELAQDAFVLRIDSVETSTAEGRNFDIVSGVVTENVFGDKQTSEPVSWNQFKISANVKLPGMPQYEPGKEYLVFLSGPGKGTGFQSPIGLGQGMFKVKRLPDGRASVQNGFMNSTVFRSLNTDKIIQDMAAAKSRTRGANPQVEAQKLKASLRPGPAIGLDAVKEAAQFLHEKKQQGAHPAKDYLTTAPVMLQPVLH